LWRLEEMEGGLEKSDAARRGSTLFGVHRRLESGGMSVGCTGVEIVLT
jgi:hypothetical protein